MKSDTDSSVSEALRSLLVRGNEGSLVRKCETPALPEEPVPRPGVVGVLSVLEVAPVLALS